MDDSDQPMISDSLGFLQGGGDMGALIRARNWSETPIGAPENWPQSLRTVVSLCLSSNFPINIVWGPDHTQIYNDGYRDCCGDAHPRALGEDYRVTWASAWSVIGTSFERASAGETMFLENQRMFLPRLKGALEETFFTFSHSPIRDESGGIGGLFHPVTETTNTILSQRRAHALRDLSADLGAATDAADVARRTVGILAERAFDLPFLLYYALDEGDGTYRLAGHYGIAPGRAATPLAFEPDATGPWPFAKALSTPHFTVVDDLGTICEGDPCGPYEQPPHCAVMIRIDVPSAARSPALVIAGVSPRLTLNEAYRDLYRLLGVTISGALATVRAREDERQRALALAEIDRAKTDFFSNVSHEFRTPLSLMLGPLEELREHAQLGAEDRAHVDVAHRNGLRMLKLVNTLLDFSRVEAGRAQANYTATELGAFTADLASNFRSACERAGLRLEVDCPPLAEPVHVDRDMWEKIVLNLLSNAFKFTFEGTIAVSIRARDGAAELVVRDTGTGIAPSELPRLFERFHRIDNARARTHEGTGIGLALIRELVLLHGGHVDVVSTLGEGAAFTVRIPCGTAHLPPDRIDAAPSLISTATRAEAFLAEAIRWLPEAADADETDAAIGMNAAHPFTWRGPAHVGAHDRPCVLVAEDNADMRDHIRRILAARYEVVAVADGQAALSAIQMRRPDLLLADVMMPRLDGLGLLRAVRASPLLRDLPVILVSARAGEAAWVEGLEAGADDYLVKPFGARELAARVRASLDLARVRREAAEAVIEREKRFRALVTATSYVIYRMGPDWSEMRELDGRGFLTDSAAPSADWLAEYIHPEDQAQVLAAIAEAIRTKGNFELEHRVRRADGSLGWMRSRAVPLLDADGEIQEWFGAASDVTTRRHAQATLRESEQRQRVLMESIPQLVWQEADDGLWSWASRQWTAYTGLSDADSRGLGWLVALHPDDRDAATAAWKRAKAAGLFEADYRIRRADGTWRWFQARAVPVRGSPDAAHPDGAIIEWIGTATDIEDQVTAREMLARSGERLEAQVAERTAQLMATEEALRQTQKMEAIGQLTAGIAHDFNNMLQGVVGGLDMARRRIQGSRVEEAARYLDAAREAVNRAAALTRRLLAFSRRQLLNPKPVDPDRLVAGMVELIQRAVGPGVGLELMLRDGAAGVLCDAHELENALLNLCINARDAMPDGGRLTIGTGDVQSFAEGVQPGRYVAISVADTGVGMTAAVVERAFEPFFTTKPQGQGTGLGLSQVWGFAQQSGGHVRLQSAPGQGTTVRLLLPRHDVVAAAEAPRETPAPPAASPGPGKRILLVDDEDAVRLPAAERLRELGYTVLEAQDGPGALRLMEDAAPIHLLVTDVGLPNGMNGRQVAEAICERVPGLPVLFITGYAGTALPAGLNVLGKPFDLDALAARAESILAVRCKPER